MEQHPILNDIAAFLKRNNDMAESTFGRLVEGNWKLINELKGKGRKRPRRLWPTTEQKIRDRMAELDGAS